MTISHKPSARTAGIYPLALAASALALGGCASAADAEPGATQSSQSLVGSVPDNEGDDDEQQTDGTQAPNTWSEDPQEGEAPAVRQASLAPDATGAASYTQYIAFGDSFTSGFGLSDANPKSCAQSQAAWPQRVNTGLGIETPLIFAACSGATTQDILANGPDVVPGYQTGPQIDQLPPPEKLNSALITIQIGGNDIKLGDSVQECSSGLSSLKMTTATPESLGSLSTLTPRCATLDKLLDNYNEVVRESLEPSLEYTFSALRAAAPNATIVAVGYPHLVNATSSCRGLFRLFSTRYRRRMNDLGDAINAKIASAAATAGILSVTDQVVAQFQGHEMCSAQEWISSATIHPNAAGHQAYAQIVMAVTPMASTRTVAIDEAGVPAPASEPSADSAEDPSGIDPQAEPDQTDVSQAEDTPSSQSPDDSEQDAEQDEGFAEDAEAETAEETEADDEQGYEDEADDEQGYEDEADDGEGGDAAEEVDEELEEETPETDDEEEGDEDEDQDA